MKKLAFAACLGLSLTSCGTILFPKDIVLGVSDVEFASSIGKSDDLSVTVTYSVGCGDKDQALNVVSRTANTLTLSATGKNQGIGMACAAQYVEKTLTYVDPGTTPRTGPFEVIVNGKSWGKIAVHD